MGSVLEKFPYYNLSLSLSPEITGEAEYVKQGDIWGKQHHCKALSTEPNSKTNMNIKKTISPYMNCRTN